MAAPAAIAKRNTKALDLIAAEIQEVKTGLLQLDGALAKRLDEIAATLADLAAPKPAAAAKKAG
ncbi:MAG: hypothetical protein ABI353_11455 [Isosphaeraceae bacterium]